MICFGLSSSARCRRSSLASFSGSARGSRSSAGCEPRRRTVRSSGDPSCASSRSTWSSLSLAWRWLAIFLVVLISALAVLLNATLAVSNIVERILGTPAQEEFRNIQHDLGFPLINLIVFGTVWLFHRRVVQSEAARETALERAATIRRLYTYLIALIGLGMLAV